MKDLLNKLRMPGSKSKQKNHGKAGGEGSSSKVRQDSITGSTAPGQGQQDPQAPEPIKQNAGLQQDLQQNESKPEAAAHAGSNGGAAKAAEGPSVPSKSAVEVLQKLGLDKADLSQDDKLEAMCIILKETLAENVKQKETSANLTEQLGKNEETKEALQKLCKALKAQVDLKSEEGELKLREETKKRIECAKSFEATVNELSQLVEKHSGHNQNLRQENESLAEKLRELLKAHEAREMRIDELRTEFQLQTKLFEAQLAKAKLEKAEVAANFNQERLHMQKQLLEEEDKVGMLIRREQLMQDQIQIYQKQYQEIEQNLGGNAKSFQHFRKEIERVNGQLQQVERDTTEWRLKFEDSQELIKGMNLKSLERENEVESLKRKLVAMEKLNRHLSQERSALLKRAEEVAENE